ncbi:MAG: NADH-quinone oxidoreductase subunit H [Sulfurovum sp.]|nr:NADH-quinone oxidoreductase subunit H [Sulfurovum sp.]
MTILFWMIFQVVMIALAAPLFDGIARVLRARLQSRKGPPDFFQTYRDIIKLYKRSRTAPRCAHWFFTYAPFFLYATGAAMLAAMPITYGGLESVGYADIFVLVYLAALLKFVFGVASIDSGNPFAAVGGSREQMIGVFVEPVLIISLLVVMLLAGTSNLVVIQQMVLNGEVGFFMPAYAVASISFLWAMYVESGRNPYDLAEAEQELQEGVLGEYSGSDFGIAQAALILKQFAMIGLFITIFQPWNFGLEHPFLALIVFLVKAGVFYVAAVFIDNFGARYKLLSGFKSNATAALSISVVALVLYIVGV